MPDYSYSRLPPKETIIKIINRDRIVQSIFNIITILAIISIMVVSCIRFIDNTFDWQYGLSTVILFLLIGIYTKYINNRIQFTQRGRRKTLEMYEKIQETLKAMYDKPKDGGSQQNTKD